MIQKKISTLFICITLILMPCVTIGSNPIQHMRPPKTQVLRDIITKIQQWGVLDAHTPLTYCGETKTLPEWYDYCLNNPRDVRSICYHDYYITTATGFKRVETQEEAKAWVIALTKGEVFGTINTRNPDAWQIFVANAHQEKKSPIDFLQSLLDRSEKAKQAVCFVPFAD